MLWFPFKIWHLTSLPPKQLVNINFTSGPSTSKQLTIKSIRHVPHHPMDISVLRINLVNTRQVVTEIQCLKSLLLAKQSHNSTASPLQAFSKTFPIRFHKVRLKKCNDLMGCEVGKMNKSITGPLTGCKRTIILTLLRGKTNHQSQ